MAEDWLDSPEAQDALSLMNFQSGPLAHLYQELGEGPVTKAEAEQAFILTKRLKFVRDFGKDWYTHFVAEVGDVAGRVKELRREAWRKYRADVEEHARNAAHPKGQPPRFRDPDEVEEEAAATV